MKPRRPPIEDQQVNSHLVELIQIVKPDHAMIKLAAVVAWLDQLFGATFCPVLVDHITAYDPVGAERRRSRRLWRSANRSLAAIE